MPNLTTPFLNLKGQDINEDMKKINEWSVSLIDELKTILCNLDSGNVTEAGSVKAQNIDVAQARIKGAQIQSLTADKLTAGTIDAREIIVKNIDADNINTGKLNTGEVVVGDDNDYGSVEMDGDSLIFYEKLKDEDGNYLTDDSGEILTALRIALGRKDEAGTYIFIVQNREGTQGIEMDSEGNINITGNIKGASNISITTNATIGRVLNFMDKDTATNGGIISISNNDFYIAGLNGRRIVLNTDSNIELNCKSCSVNGKAVLTEE